MPVLGPGFLVLRFTLGLLSISGPLLKPLVLWDMVNTGIVSGQGPETPQLGLHVATTRMGRCINKPVGRQDTVLAGTANPVVAGMVISCKVHHLNSALARDDISLCGLFAITSVMMSRCLQIHHDGIGHLDRSGVQIAALIEIKRRGRCHRTAGMQPLPDQAINHKDIKRGMKPAARLTFPELLSILRGQRCKHPG
ncbi:hypothetical protein ES703_97347 [subsurface metagenome]